MPGASPPAPRYCDEDRDRYLVPGQRHFEELDRLLFADDHRSDARFERSIRNICRRQQRIVLGSCEAYAPNIAVKRCWKFGYLAPFQILLAALRNRVDVLHLEYDVYLYGGVVAAVILPFALRLIRGFTVRGSSRPCTESSPNGW